MNLPDVLIDHPDGEIRVKGSRISLYNLMTMYHQGCTPEAVAREFDSVSLDQIRQVFLYYESNRAEVDTYTTSYRAELDGQRSEAIPGPSLAELRRRLEEKRRRAGVN